MLTCYHCYYSSHVHNADALLLLYEVIITIFDQIVFQVKEYDVECSSSWTDMSDFANLTTMMTIVTDILSELKQGKILIDFCE